LVLHRIRIAEGKVRFPRKSIEIDLSFLKSLLFYVAVLVDFDLSPDLETCQELEMQEGARGFRQSSLVDEVLGHKVAHALLPLYERDFA
jgi:hypothetical protein